MTSEPTHSRSGRPLHELTMEAIRAGELTAGDLSISGETLRHQADVAENAGYRQLAENLRRAAELTLLSNEEVLDIYRALRPGRRTHYELMGLADHLEKDRKAARTAALIREAAEVYRERELVK